MSGLERSLALALREHAEGDVHIAELIGGARRLGRRYRRRRRALGLGSGAVLALVASVGAGAVVPARWPRLNGPGVPGARAALSAPASLSPTPFPSPASMSGLSRPPVLGGVRPAAVDPGVVGSDPMLLHFDLDAAVVPAPLLVAQWDSLGGLERLVFQAAGPVGAGQVQVSRWASQLDPLGRKGTPVRVGKAEGTLTGNQLRWQPVPGVWAQVEVSGDKTAIIRFAQGVVFDRVLRCAVPFRLTWVPAGARVRSCAVIFAADGAHGRITIGMPGAAPRPRPRRRRPGWPARSAGIRRTWRSTRVTAARRCSRSIWTSVTTSWTWSPRAGTTGRPCCGSRPDSATPARPPTPLRGRRTRCAEPDRPRRSPPRPAPGPRVWPAGVARGCGPRVWPAGVARGCGPRDYPTT
jgi:hypothetical protein